MLKRLSPVILLCILVVITTSAQDEDEMQTLLVRLDSTPTFSNFTTESVRVIYARGQVIGNRSQVFTKMGDSDTTQGAFLRPMGEGPSPGAYCDLGAYTGLQETLDYFSSVPPRHGVKNSFDNTSMLAHKGYSTVSVLDPLLAPGLCEIGESPLDCEYRVMRPSVAIIMFGLMDIQFLSVEDYKTNMSRIIERSIDQGVIPILSTFVVQDGNAKLNWYTAMRFNNALLDLAAEYRVPLINLWHEVQSLPNQGLSPDNVHMGYPSTRFCDFTGSEHRYGGVLRNLLTLQALDILRREIFLNEVH